MRKTGKNQSRDRCRRLIRWLPGAVFLVLWVAAPALAEMEVVGDAQNCLICHRYPSIGRFDESGRKHIYYINEQMYANSVHGKLRCGDCHTDINKIPHQEVKKVDCTTKCHVKDPSTNKEFSHAQTAEKMKTSVHAVDLPEPLAADLPTCKDCHGNRITKQDGLWDMMLKASKETEARCGGCHRESPWVRDFFPHFTRRIHPVRTQLEIVNLCADCHSDSQKMARHGIESADTFKDTFHWNLVKFGVSDAPDCLSCHVATGANSHNILPRKNPDSSVNIMNRVNTCSNQDGARACHPAATPAFATGRVHAYGVKAALASGWADLTGMRVSDDVPERLVEEAFLETTESESVRFVVLELVRFFYKVLIGLVIFGMFYHQWMDFLAHRRERKKKKRKGQHGRKDR
jgi:hypothetical protein